MIDLSPNIAAALIGAIATAILGAIAYFIKRGIEKKDKVEIDHFLDRYERLRCIGESNNPPHATEQEFKDANKFVTELHKKLNLQETEEIHQYEGQLTQADMNRIGGAKLAEADAKVNVTISELMTYQDGARAEALDDAIKKWREFRHEYAVFVAEGYRGGSIQSLIYSNSAEDITNQFNDLLKLQIESEKHV